METWGVWKCRPLQKKAISKRTLWWSSILRGTLRWNLLTSHRFFFAMPNPWDVCWGDSMRYIHIQINIYIYTHRVYVCIYIYISIEYIYICIYIYPPVIKHGSLKSTSYRWLSQLQTLEKSPGFPRHGLSGEPFWLPEIWMKRIHRLWIKHGQTLPKKWRHFYIQNHYPLVN